MSTTVGSALMSFEEFERLADTPEELELLKGELIRLPPPQASHMEACERLFELLKAALAQLGATRPEMGRVHMEMGYLLSSVPRSWLRPDVSLTHFAQTKRRYYEGAPLIAFEVVSENDTARDLDAKAAEYLKHGSAEVWVIYPDKQYALVYRPGPSVSLETQIRTELLPGVEIALSEVLASPSPDPRTDPSR